MPQNNEVPTEEVDTKTIIQNWEELQKIPIQDYFARGWKPRVKSKPNGKRYITIRNKWKDDEGWHDSEKSLGPYDPERWEAILEIYPKKTIFPKPYSPRSTKKSSILGSKLVKPKPLGSTVHLSLETLQWYVWTQSKGYSGTLDDFINQCVKSYFKNYQGIELAVVLPQEA